ncbi:uncharacterized protein LOC123316306 [Coccinella septempunctata]|uniref:uncharacterized protein LOC123316306 n=1 Tax=Coccinella septempunctata TaxID=41139 RepID=UPI001D07DD85|nr:uncharacterized protein LOC123316306 [Coccinella septempunctata]
MILKNLEFVDELDGELGALIHEITPHFEESLIRAFKNDTLSYHRQEKKQCFHTLDDVIHPIGETMIELRNLQLAWVPDFRINQLRAHLGMLCLDFQLNLGSLNVEGEYGANNARLQEFLPVAHEGRATITFNNMTAKGRVGLFINDDSLLPENNDTVYETREVDIRVRYQTTNSRYMETKISRNNVEETLGISMWSQLTQILTGLLSSQLKRVLSEFSLSDLFGDKMEHFRKREKELIHKSNRLADHLLCSAKDFIVHNDFREVFTPNYDIIFRGKPTSISLGNLRTSQGDLKDLSTLNRQKCWSCYANDKELIFFGFFSLKIFKHTYRVYEAEFESTKVSGSINMSVHRNGILFRVKFLRNDTTCEYVMEAVELQDVGDIDVDISGLASLGWLHPRVVSWTIANFRHQGKRVLEKLIKESFDYAIEEMNKANEYPDTVEKFDNKVT